MRASFLRLCALWSFSFIAAAAATGCGGSELGSEPEPLVLPDIFVPTVAETPPPPLSGGTLIVTADEKRAIAADPERDVVWVVDLAGEELERTIVLEERDEPGRLVEDGAGLTSWCKATGCWSRASAAQRCY
jgi:hypothetical protein